MSEPKNTSRSDFSPIQLLPNVMTIAAICIGLSAIRFGVQGDYKLAVQMILAAGVLDGLDGKLARRLGSDSDMGAELDSLADFLNFGVAPPLIVYYWALQDIKGLAWIAVLVFAICCVLRLARFNVGNKSETLNCESAYFEGVPAPAGALLVMLPMYLSFAFTNTPLLPDFLICGYMIFAGLLMISRVPTWSFKTTKISRENVKFFLVGIAVIGAAVLIFAWETLIVLCVAYVGTVIWSWFGNDVSSE